MNLSPDPSAQVLPLLRAAQAWQRGEAPREALTGPLVLLPPGEGGGLVSELIGALLAQADASPPAGAEQRGVGDWRSELLACRARAWASPAAAGLLVGPGALILTDGRRGVVLTSPGTRALASGTSASLLLLAQTIVMADHAVDAQELGRLRQQRIESTSTSLSEIDPIA